MIPRLCASSAGATASAGSRSSARGWRKRRGRDAVDLLVGFEPGAEPGLIGLARIELEICLLGGRRVDLRTPGDLGRHFRDDVLRSAAVQFGA